MNPRRDATNALPGGGTYVDAWNGVGYDGDAGHWSYGWTNSASLFRYDLVPGTTGADANDYQTAWQNDDHSYSASEYYGGGVDSNQDGGTDGGVGLAGDWAFLPWMVWPEYGGHFAGLASWQYWQWQHDVEHNGVNAGGDYTANGSLTLTPTLQTELHLRTGGKQMAGRQDLFCLNATGQKYVSSAVGYYANIDVYPLAWSAQDLAAGEIQVMGQALGADHNLWLTLPPGADLPLPVKVAADQCTVTVSQQKYKLQIFVNGSNPLWPDHVPSYDTFCVGEYLNFTPTWSPSTPPFVDASAIWTLPGTFVNYQPDVNCDGYYDKNPDFLIWDWSMDHSLSTWCWYVKDFQAQSAKVAMNLYSSNGQILSL